MNPNQQTAVRQAAPAAQAHGKLLINASIIGASVFLACLLGILTRPTGMLATLWPANALLLGLFVRYPRLATPLGYLAAAAAYTGAEFATGGTLLPTLLLTVANLAGVASGHVLFARLPRGHQRLNGPNSVLHLALNAAIAAAVAGAVGVVGDPVLDTFSGWEFWFTTEFANYIAILPVILSLPDRKPASPARRRRLQDLQRPPLFHAEQVAPVAAATAALLFGGPGAVAFAVPALLWCAIALSQFTTAILTLLYSQWILLAISTGFVTITTDVNSRPVLTSLRMAVALVALGPIMVASVMAARNTLQRRLERMALHDHLTGLLNRRSFTEDATAMLESLAAQRQPVAVMMVDIDHFKAINDTFGHAAGDDVIASTAAVLKRCIRQTELAGRLGGEEFAVVVPGCSKDDALAIAERMRVAFADNTVTTMNGDRITATISIGVAHAVEAPGELGALLAAADAALYRAKAEGRNRVNTDNAAMPTLITNAPPL